MLFFFIIKSAIYQVTPESFLSLHFSSDTTLFEKHTIDDQFAIFVLVTN